jgi:sugar phosphate isomerase/epimerase
MSNLPVIGAALMSGQIAANIDLLREKERDIEIQDFLKIDVLDGDWEDAVIEARRLLTGHKGRIGIHGPFLGFSIASMDPEIRAVVSRRMHQALDVCEMLGASHMVVHSPFTTWDYNNLPANPGYHDAICHYARETLASVVTRAENIGLTIVVENIEDKDPAARVKLVESFASPAMAVSLDTGHAHYAHGTNGAPPVDYYVHAAGNLLQHVHLQDADGYADRHWQIGRGTVNWHAIFAALSHYSSTPRLILELRDISGLRASLDFLQREGLGQ